MDENPCLNQEIHVLFENGFKLQNTLDKPRVVYITLYAESAADQTDHFADVFARENDAHSTTTFLN